MIGLFIALWVGVSFGLASFPAKAQEGTPTGTIGVKVGDWATYDASDFSYESNIPGYEEAPVGLKVLSSIEWFIGEVTEISGNSVTMQWGGYYEDGTKQFETQTGDPISGSGNLSLAPAGIGPGDQFYIWLEEWGFPGPQRVTVSETVSRPYAGEAREVNHVTISLPHPEGGTYTFDCYFDKGTGILCEETVRYSVKPPDGLYMRYSWTVVMTETNLWGPPSAVIPGPQSVTETNPVIIDAVETAGTMVIISNISDSCVIKIERATDAPPTPIGKVTVGNSIFINTSKMVTTTAVLRLSYDPAELSAKGITESSLTIHYWNGGAWVPVESHVNAEEQYVWADIDHFSYWALMGKTASSGTLAYPTVIVDGRILSLDVPPVIEEGRTLVPLRAIFETLGAEVEWDGATRTVTATKGETVIYLTIGDKRVRVGSQVVTLDVPGRIVNGRTLVPLRFVSESLGAQVHWDGATRVVTVKTPPKMELAEAVSKGLVEVSAYGRNTLESIQVNIVSKTKEPIEITILPGTIFESRSADIQNMVITTERIVSLKPFGGERFVLDAACANMQRDVPGAEDNLSVRSLSPSEDLIRLLNLPAFCEETFRVQQFAIWTISDNPEPDGYMGIGYFGLGTGPTDKEMEEIRSLFEEAGIFTGKYRALR